MNRLEKSILDQLSELYFYARQAHEIEATPYRVNVGIKYTELRDDLKEYIQNRRVKQE